MGELVVRNGLKFASSLPSGAGDNILTVDPATLGVGSISSIDTSVFVSNVLPSANIYVGNGSNVATAVGVTGDIAIDNAGVVSISTGVIVNADINASAAIAFSKMAPLTASRALVSDGSGLVTVSAVTATELGYLSGVTSALQTQLNAKQATITGGATSITSANLTASRALVSDGSGKVGVATTTATEIGYVNGVTSSIQTQLDSKQPDIQFKDEGVNAGTSGGVTTVAFVGAGVSAVESSGTLTVTIAGVANGLPSGGTADQYLSKIDGTDYNTQWSTLTVSKITDITATAAEINALAGAGVSGAEMGYLNGVTSSIQAQLDLKLDRALTNNYMFVGNASNVAIPLATGANGYVLTSVGGVPTWVAPGTGGTVTSVDVSGGTTGLTTSGGPVSTSGTITLAGTLIAANGGTGFASYAVGDILYANTTTTLAKLGAGTATYVLTSNGAGVAPSWQASGSGGAWLLASGGTLTGNNLVTGSYNIDFAPNRLQVTQNALASSWVKALTVTPGAHTAITNTLENINNDFGAVTQTWAGGGTVATQRGTYFRSQTLAGASAQTFTNAYTLYVDPPVAGTNATITNNWAAGFNGNTLITGNTFIASSGTITANTKLDVRGIGTNTSTTFSLLLSDAANTLRFRVSDNGTFNFNNMLILANRSFSYTATGSNGPDFSNTTTVTSTVGSYYSLKTSVAFSPSSGTATYAGLSIDGTYNVTGGTTTVYGIDYNPTLTSMTGATHYAIRTTSGGVLLAGGLTTSDAGATITANTKLDVRGISGGNVQVWKNNGGTTQLGVITNQGSVSFVQDSITTPSASAAKVLAVTPGSHTSMTASTEFLAYHFSGGAWSWSAGTVGTQRWALFEGSVVDSGTVTHGYTLYTTAPTAGSGTLTNAWAAGFDGNTLVTGDFYLGNTLTGGATRKVIADGSSSNVSLVLKNKGTADFSFETTSGSVSIIPAGSATFINIKGTGTTPSVSLASSSSNSGLFIQSDTASSGDILLYPADSGPFRVRIRGSAGSAAGGNVEIFGGSPGSGNNNGGSVYLASGTPAGSGTEGNVYVQSRAAGKLSFFNVTPVVQQSGLTAITHTAPGTPDYAIQDLTNSGGFGFATKDEGNTVLSVIKAMHDAMKAYGLLN
jgi:hypothetical protein